MRATADPIDTATHRLIAVRLFNRVWEFMEKADRTSEEDDEMLHAAHASRYHWGHVREPSLHHARRSLELCEQDRRMAKAREASAQIAESDDRRHFDDGLATVPA